LQLRNQEEADLAQKAAFDGAAFYSALDAERESRGLNWKQVSAETSVSASTLTRMGQGARPDLDGLASLCAWSGLDPEEFIRVDGVERKAEAEPLAKITALLHSDPRLDDHGATIMEQVMRATYGQVATD
jgi:transcriptional regulator with XRE-family HTH domain